MTLSVTKPVCERPLIVSSRLWRPYLTSDPYAAGLTFARSAFTGWGPRGTKRPYVRYNYHRVG